MRRIAMTLALTLLASTAFAGGGQGSTIAAGAAAGAQAGSVAILDASQGPVYNDNPRNPVSSAVAPGWALGGGEDDCSGAASAGAQGIGFGVSASTTVALEHCIKIRQAKFAAAVGDAELSNAIMCLDPRWKKAVESLGRDCPKVEGDMAADTPIPATEVVAGNGGPAGWSQGSEN